MNYSPALDMLRFTSESVGVHRTSVTDLNETIRKGELLTHG